MTSQAHLVDDDEAIRDAFSWLLDSRGVNCCTWQSAEAFLAAYDGDPCRFQGCLILDVRMDGMSGLELYERLLERHCRLPVVFLTGHGDVPMAVGALKRGAFDFIEKPFNDNELVNKVLAAIAHDDKQREASADHDSIRCRLGTLSDRERQVMDLVLAGKLNKIIADDLGISMRTVEVHRARLFEKMAVKSAVELAQLLSAISPPQS
jgi:two-component system response regulator DctR